MGSVVVPFLGVLPGSVLEAANVPQTLAYFNGHCWFSYATRKSLISIAVITTILWVIFAFLMATGRPVFPLLPIVGTIWLVYQVLRLSSLPIEEGN